MPRRHNNRSIESFSVIFPCEFRSFGGMASFVLFCLLFSSWNIHRSDSQHSILSATSKLFNVGKHTQFELMFDICSSFPHLQSPVLFAVFHPSFTLQMFGRALKAIQKRLLDNEAALHKKRKEEHERKMFLMRSDWSSKIYFTATLSFPYDFLLLFTMSCLFLWKFSFSSSNLPFIFPAEKKWISSKLLQKEEEENLMTLPFACSSVDDSPSLDSLKSFEILEFASLVIFNWAEMRREKFRPQLTRWKSTSRSSQSHQLHLVILGEFQLLKNFSSSSLHTKLYPLDSFWCSLIMP